MIWLKLWIQWLSFILNIETLKWMMVKRYPYSLCLHTARIPWTWLPIPSFLYNGRIRGVQLEHATSVRNSRAGWSRTKVLSFLKWNGLHYSNFVIQFYQILNCNQVVQNFNQITFIAVPGVNKDGHHLLVIFKELFSDAVTFILMRHTFAFAKTIVIYSRWHWTVW